MDIEKIFPLVLTGLFLIVNRVRALSQVIGYLVLENGIYLFGLALATGLIALTLVGSTSLTLPLSGLEVTPETLTIGLAVVAVVATVVAIARALRTSDPFLDVRLFRHVPFSAASLVSLGKPFISPHFSTCSIVFPGATRCKGPSDSISRKSLFVKVSKLLPPSVYCRPS